MIANTELRAKIVSHGFRLWEVAREVGVSQACFSVWLREDLSGSRKQRVDAALDRLIEQRSKV